MPDCFDELTWRGFVQDATPQLREHLASGSRTAYCGFDPTAPSLQVGNLMPIMLLAQLQRGGHRPIVLMGGGTGLIGDPSGKRSERPLLSKEQIRENLQKQRDQMSRFLQFGTGSTAALLLDNAKWLVELKLVDFLRDIGKHFSVNVMLQKESVQARLEGGLSYTEFSYMLLQSYDFLHLYRDKQCTLQVGGSDQWGNITAGAELIRRIDGGEAHALVAPLVTTSSGAKFGKTEGESVWLDPAMTSPYKFYQFWVNTEDRDVERYVKLFTFRKREGADGVDALIRMHQKDPSRREAQYTLAADVTEIVHGKPATESAVAVSAILFNDWDPRHATEPAFAMLAQEIPTAEASSDGALQLVDAAVQTGLAKSKSEARRAIEQGGIYVNQQRESDVSRTLEAKDWLAGGHILLRKGKKDYALLRKGR